MMAAPSVGHQRVVFKLGRKLGDYFDGKPCEPFISPIDVRLNYDKGNNNVVQPDLVVVCDKDKIDEKVIKGAPDLVIEIVSPNSVKMDTFVKFNKYQHAGVKEYWLVNPELRAIEVHLLENEMFVRAATYAMETEGEEPLEDVLYSRLFDGLSIRLEEIFS